jgi:serine/threonine protein kinase
MGEVHAALDRLIGREVALKAVRSGQRARAALQVRFLREARVQGQLEHPSIVPVYDLSSDSGAFYFTMRRVRGVTLETIVEALAAGHEAMRARFSRRRLLTAFESVCLAVDFAHARGVVHRDLKPSNIMLGEFGEVQVLDWGVATLVDSREGSHDSSVDAGTSSTPTEAGSLVGTLGYAAPEQLRSETVTPRSDVYALGAVLFEILALVPLHARGRATDMSRSTVDGADAHVSRRAPEREVPPELEAACVRATALHPADRFASARELHDAIERFLDGDRDVEHRRELAQGHARRALEAVARATAATSEGFDVQRTLALKEATQSLTLDPTNTDAMAAVLRLRARPTGRVLSYLPLVAWMGLREPLFLALPVRRAASREGLRDAADADVAGVAVAAARTRAMHEVVGAVPAKDTPQAARAQTADGTKS